MKSFLFPLNLAVLALALCTRSFAQSNELDDLTHRIKEIFRQRYGKEIQFTLSVGTAALGEEIYRVPDKTLTIDTTPCGPEPHAVVYFVWRWKEDRGSDGTCSDGKLHRQLQVIQQKPEH